MLIRLVVIFILIVLDFKFGFIVCFFMILSGIGNVLVCSNKVRFFVFEGVKLLLIFFVLVVIIECIIGVVSILLFSIIVNGILIWFLVILVKIWLFVLFSLKVIIGLLVLGLKFSCVFFICFLFIVICFCSLYCWLFFVLGNIIVLVEDVLFVI